MYYDDETASKESDSVTDNGNDVQSGTGDDEEEHVVVDEILDKTTEENDSEKVDVEVEDDEGETVNVETEENDVTVEDNEDVEDGEYVTGDGQEVLAEEEETYEGEGEEDAVWSSNADADTQIIAETGEDEENEGDELNISVEDNETLGIEQDGKAANEDEANADADADAETRETAVEKEEKVEEELDTSNVTSTTGKFEADSDNKANEGETETVAEKGAEQERHIILVTGLSADTSANDLKTFFRKFGKIGRIKIMTNTRVPGSQRFAHISVPSLDELNHLVGTLNGVQLKGKYIRVAKAPEDGSVSRSYEIAVATAKAEADEGDGNDKTDTRKASGSADSATGDAAGTAESGKDAENSDEVQVVQDTTGGKDAGKKDLAENGKKPDSPGKKEEKKDNVTTSTPEKKSPEKNTRPDSVRSPGQHPPPHHRSRRESHDRPRGEYMRPHHRQFRRDKDSTEWKRHGPPRGPMEVTRVHRDRPPMGRGQIQNSGRRRSPHAPQLTFEQIREIRDEQRRREHERRKREEERERAAEVERQKRLEYQNYMEFKQLEREREKLRMERERIEREKQELIKLERERQKAEREKIEREKEELRRAKMTIEHPRAGPVKRPYEDDKVMRRRESDERKKPYVPDRGRPDGKTEAERKVERERYARERLHSSSHGSDNRSRSPFRASGVGRESRRDVWARDDRDPRSTARVRSRSDERRDHHRRETEAEKVAAAERRSREAPSRAAASSADLISRHPMDSSHSSSRSLETTKRTSDRYEEARTSTARDGEWMQRSYLPPTSSLSMPMSTSATTSRDSWPFTERKLDAWDTSRLPPRTEQWISGAGATVGATGRSSMPVIAPPPPLYSSAATSLALQGAGLGLGSYASSADRYESYRSGFHPLRKY